MAGEAGALIVFPHFYPCSPSAFSRSFSENGPSQSSVGLLFPTFIPNHEDVCPWGGCNELLRASMVHVIMPIPAGSAM